ncbi:unnamed protein product [Pedinophyceae sp. YPF-701]|nr:unnamed protein product [Pedinophyceae sp. YPF-701]
MDHRTPTQASFVTPRPGMTPAPGDASVGVSGLAFTLGAFGAMGVWLAALVRPSAAFLALLPALCLASVLLVAASFVAVLFVEPKLLAFLCNAVAARAPSALRSSLEQFCRHLETGPDGARGAAIGRAASVTPVTPAPPGVAEERVREIVRRVLSEERPSPPPAQPTPSSVGRSPRSVRQVLAQAGADPAWLKDWLGAELTRAQESIHTAINGRLTGQDAHLAEALFNLEDLAGEIRNANNDAARMTRETKQAVRDEIHNNRAQLSDMGDQLAAARDAIKALEEALRAELKESIEGAKKEAADATEALGDALRGEAKTQRAEVDAAIADAKKEAADATEALGKALREEAKTQKESVDAAIEGAKKEAADATEALGKALREEAKTQKENVDAAIEGARKEAADATEALGDALREEAKTQKESVDAAIEGAKKEAADAMKEQKESVDAAIEGAKKEAADAMKEQKESVDAAIEGAKKEAADAMKEQKESVDAAIEGAKKEAADAMKEQKMELEAAVADAKKEASENTKALREELDAAVASAKKEASDATNKLGEALRAEAKEALEQAVREAAKAGDPAAEGALRADLDALKGRLDLELGAAASSEEVRAAVASLRTELEGKIQQAGVDAEAGNGALKDAVMREVEDRAKGAADAIGALETKLRELAEQAAAAPSREEVSALVAREVSSALQGEGEKLARVAAEAQAAAEGVETRLRDAMRGEVRTAVAEAHRATEEWTKEVGRELKEAKDIAGGALQQVLGARDAADRAAAQVSQIGGALRAAEARLDGRLQELERGASAAAGAEEVAELRGLVEGLQGELSQVSGTVADMREGVEGAMQVAEGSAGVADDVAALRRDLDALRGTLEGSPHAVTRDDFARLEVSVRALRERADASARAEDVDRARTEAERATRNVASLATKFGELKKRLKAVEAPAMQAKHFVDQVPEADRGTIIGDAMNTMRLVRRLKDQQDTLTGRVDDLTQQMSAVSNPMYDDARSNYFRTPGQAPQGGATRTVSDMATPVLPQTPGFPTTYREDVAGPSGVGDSTPTMQAGPPGHTPYAHVQPAASEMSASPATEATRETVGRHVQAPSESIGSRPAQYDSHTYGDPPTPTSRHVGEPPE